MARFLVTLSILVATVAADGPEPTAPPPALHLDPFYSQYLDADGIPVTASSRVPPEALGIARDIVVAMLAHRPDLRAALVARGQRVGIMAESEGTTDLPEQRDWKKPARNDPRLTRCERKHYRERIGRLTDAEYWNARARGMSGVFTTGAAEGLLALPSSRYYNQDIFVHEFAHDILDAVQAADPSLYAQVERAYADAMAKGRWKGEYASTDIREYWAVGTQFWFNSAPVATFDGRKVLSDADLTAYDPALAATLRAAYGDTHRIAADRYYMSPARVPAGPLPANTAEIC